MEVGEQLKQLSKDTVFYGLGSALQMFISFFLFPIYTRMLTQADFGAQDLVTTAITIITFILVLGLDSAAARYYYEANTDQDKKSIISTWLWFQVLLSFPISIILIIFAQSICTVIFNDGSLAPYFRLGIVALPMTLIANILAMTLRLTFQSKNFMLVTVSGITVQALSAVYLVVILNMGISGVFLAIIIATIFRAALTLIFTYRQIGPLFSLSQLKPMLIFGIPLLPASLSVWILNYSNRYFLVHLGTLEDIGLLSVGSKVASIVTFVISAFQIGWGPFAFSLIKNENLAKQTYSKVLTYFLLITFFATVSLTIFAREAVLVLATASYESSTVLVPWFCYASIAWGMVYIVGMGYSIAKKSYHTTIATILGAGLNFGLNFLLIPKWGILGAAISTMLGNVVALTYSYFIGQHYFNVVYEYNRVFRLIGLATISIATAISIDYLFSNWSTIILLYKFSLYLLFVIGLLVFGIVRNEEITFVKGLVKLKFSGSILKRG